MDISTEERKLVVLFDENNVIPEVCRLFGETNTENNKLLEELFSSIIIFMDNHKTAKICCHKDEIEKISVKILDKIITYPEWGLQIVNEIISDSDKIIHSMEKRIKNIELQNLSNKELWDTLEDFNTLSIKQFISGSIPMLVDIYEPLLTNNLMDYLRNKTTCLTELNNAFSILTTPTKRTTLGEEEINFIKLANEILSSTVRESLRRKVSVEEFKEQFPQEHSKLKNHHDKYFWLPHDFLGELWDLEYFYTKLSDLSNNKIEIKEILKEVVEKPVKINCLQKEFISKYQIDELHQKLFAIARGFMYTKSYRKERFTHSFYYLYKLYHEIARRYGYSLNQVRWMLHEERKNILLNNIIIEKDILDQRENGCVLLCKGGKTSINFDLEYFNRKICSSKINKEASKINGNCASRGIARGTVKKIFTTQDMTKMKQGDILIAPNTNPDIVMAMKIAGAIVTNQGGITCHAAIVSREFGIPCVVGTKVATEVLNDNDLVEVDADHGVIRIIKKS
jgi:phosphohistidine swiveling domain-containing protein